MNEHLGTNPESIAHAARLHDLVIEASGAVDRVLAAPGDDGATTMLECLRGELLSLVNTVCADDAVVTEACDAGWGAVEAIDASLDQRRVDRPLTAERTRSAA